MATTRSCRNKTGTGHIWTYVVTIGRSEGSHRRSPYAAPISPIALEAVKRIDSLFDIERDINGLTTIYP